MDASWPTTRPGARVASAPDRVKVHDALAAGTRLDEFEIVRVLGTGGFGIVYLARDHVLQRDVAIKEYMPAALAGRGHGVTVSLRSPGFAETFAKGLESFLSEARLLASFDHRSLVKVHRFWRSNETAYMAMQYYCGQTLKDARAHMSAAPDEAWLEAFVQPLLGVLELLHGEGVFHRDISPDNILLLDDGRPVLLDFGSARRVVANSPQCFTADLKPQFAPLEQYASEAGGLRQGPWTDLYALGATLYFVLTGQAPTPSVVRAVRDVLPTLSSQAKSTLRGVSPRLLATIDWTLALAPEQRPQSVLSVRGALSGALTPPAPSPRQLAAPTPTAAATDPGASARPSVGATSAPPLLTTLSSRWLGLGPEPARSRATRFGAAAALALMGAAALGWGAWTLDQPAPLPRSSAAPPVEAPMLTTRVVSSASAAPPQIVSTSADPVALEVRPEPLKAAVAEPAAAPERAALARPRTTVAATVAPPTWPAARDRHRTARSKVRWAGAPSKATARAEKTACDGPGLLERAWCAIHPCKAQRTRATPECMDRLRAEATRQQRIERQ